MATTEEIPQGAREAASMLLDGASLARIRAALRYDRYGPLMADAAAIERAIDWACENALQVSACPDSEAPAIRPDNTPQQIAPPGPYFARVDPQTALGFPRRAYVVRGNGCLLATLIQPQADRELPPDGTARLLAASWRMQQSLQRVLAWLTNVNTAEPHEISDDVIDSLIASGLRFDDVTSCRMAASAGAAALAGSGPASVAEDFEAAGPTDELCPWCGRPVIQR